MCIYTIIKEESKTFSAQYCRFGEKKTDKNVSKISSKVLLKEEELEIMGWGKENEEVLYIYRNLEK